MTISATTLSPLQLALLEKLATGNVLTRYGRQWFEGENNQCWRTDNASCELLLSRGMIAQHEGLLTRLNGTGGRESYVITSKGREVIAKGVRES